MRLIFLAADEFLKNLKSVLTSMNITSKKLNKTPHNLMHLTVATSKAILMHLTVATSKAVLLT